jgi:hypothetical protein
MTSLFESGLHVFHLGLLRSASVMTPRPQRPEWWREWQSELWHVRRSCAPAGVVTWQAEREMTSFCLGAFQDALCLRRHSWQKGRALASLHGSAAQCLLGLVVVLGASYLLSQLLPGVHAETHASGYPVNPGLILIQNAGVHDDSAPTITAQQFRIWTARRQRFFDGFAFYRILRETAGTASHDLGRVGVAHASANLFAILGLPVQEASGTAESNHELPSLILGEDLWKRKFGADPDAVGSVVHIGQRLARIAGVLPAGAWRLPGNADAWLLEPDSNLAGVGYAVGHLTALGRSEMLTPRVPITAYNSADDTEDDLSGVSFEYRTHGPWNMYLFTVFLAFLALPAITSVSMGEYNFNAHRLPWAKRLRRWGFLAAKMALLLPIVYFSSLDLAYWHSTSRSTLAEYAQLLASFSICLFGLRWMLLDQRKRCPVCLRCVTHPARVGQASRTFLSWNGTEMMCMGGHTLLHVPELPTSWFDTQRWLYLDTSWEFLFAGSGVG